MALTLDIIEQRAKALGWPCERQRCVDHELLLVHTPSGSVRYSGKDRAVENLLSIGALRDLAALESPEPARPAVDPVTGLLPCPFCGEKAEIYCVLEYHTDCLACGFGLSAALIDEARAAWNRRTP